MACLKFKTKINVSNDYFIGMDSSICLSGNKSDLFTYVITRVRLYRHDVIMSRLWGPHQSENEQDQGIVNRNYRNKSF